MKKRLTTIAVLAASAVLATAGVASAAAKDPAPRQAKNIVEVASGDKQFSTLVSLIAKAGLVDTLSGPGPFTVMAPTNAAFKKVPTATLNAIGADHDLLTQVLTYHVVSGKVMAKQVATLNGKRVATVQGSKWTVRVRPSGIYLDNPWGYAMVAKTDVKASNGVIHVIDQVLVPQSVVKQLEG